METGQQAIRHIRFNIPFYKFLHTLPHLAYEFIIGDIMTGNSNDPCIRVNQIGPVELVQ